MLQKSLRVIFGDGFFIFGAKYLHFLVIFVVLSWFLFQPKARKKEILIIAGASLPLIFVISVFAGRLYYNPRPFVAGCFQPLVYHAADNGFPSHHALLVFFISAVVFIFSHRAGLLLGVLALCVSFSRVYAGLHHTLDIAGSLAISIISVSAVYFFRKIFLGGSIK